MFSGGSFIALAAVNVVQKDPGIIVRPISWILGVVLNVVFNLVYILTSNNALGFSIIALTILVRCCMLPLAFKQQKSMFIMQKIQPEIKKIQDKYKEKASSDPEVQKKMNMEMQKLYGKHGYNPFSGCLPMLIQLPIFISLYYILQNPYQFIHHIQEIYTALGNIMLTAGNFDEVIKSVPGIFDMIPDSLRDPVTGFVLDSSEVGMSNLAKLMNKFSLDQWSFIQEQIPAVADSLKTKMEMEYFFGISLTERVGLSFPKVLIPIISGITTFFSGWLMTRRNTNMDPAMKTQQKIMNTTMPLFMAYITSTIPGGVGIYWITSNIFQICQQLFINKYYDKKMANEEGASK